MCYSLSVIHRWIMLLAYHLVFRKVWICHINSPNLMCMDPWKGRSRYSRHDNLYSLPAGKKALNIHYGFVYLISDLYKTYGNKMTMVVVVVVVDDNCSTSPCPLCSRLTFLDLSLHHKVSTYHITLVLFPIYQYTTGVFHEPSTHYTLTWAGHYAGDGWDSFEMAFTRPAGESTEGSGHSAFCQGTEGTDWGRSCTLPHQHCYDHCLEWTYKIHGPHQGTQWCTFNVGGFMYLVSLNADFC